MLLFCIFGYLKLFRISDFEFRIYLYLASFAPLQLAPWNTNLTEVELFARSAIPQGESSFFRFRNPKFNRKNQICLISIK